ncbi:MAG: glyoxalase superfamily protein [Phyllobacterium sp.]
MVTTHSHDEYKQAAKRLRLALAEDGIAVSHAKSLELIARQAGARDWNTLAARASDKPQARVKHGAPFEVGTAVEGTFNGSPARGRVVGVEETIKPDLWRLDIAFNPPVDMVTSELFSAPRRRVTMIVGSDGRSRRLTGTETGVMTLARQRA